MSNETSMQNYMGSGCECGTCDECKRYIEHMNKDNQQENTMRERLVNEGWALQSADEVAQIIEIETALARKQAIQDCIECVGKMKLGGHRDEEQRIFAGGHDEAIDKTLQALSDIQEKDK